MKTTTIYMLCFITGFLISIIAFHLNMEFLSFEWCIFCVTLDILMIFILNYVSYLIHKKNLKK